jgi:hypothetical protein
MNLDNFFQIKILYLLTASTTTKNIENHTIIFTI